MGRGRSLEREQYWQGVIDHQATSGLSIAAFCRQESISPPSFYQWRRRLSSSEPSKSVAVAKFQQIELPTVRAAMELAIRNWTVSVSPGVDAETLSKVIQAMEEPGC